MFFCCFVCFVFVVGQDVQCFYEEGEGDGEVEIVVWDVEVEVVGDQGYVDQQDEVQGQYFCGGVFFQEVGN